MTTVSCFPCPRETFVEFDIAIFSPHITNSVSSKPSSCDAVILIVNLVVSNLQVPGQLYVIHYV